MHYKPELSTLLTLVRPGVNSVTQTLSGMQYNTTSIAMHANSEIPFPLQTFPTTPVHVYGISFTSYIDTLLWGEIGGGLGRGAWLLTQLVAMHTVHVSLAMVCVFCLVGTFCG